MMANIYIIRLGEAFLKGKNRSVFERRICNQIRIKLGLKNENSIYRENGLIIIETKTIDIRDIKKLQTIFGISSIAPAVSFNNEIKQKDDLKIVTEKIVPILKDKKTFKVIVKRRNKDFPLNSNDIARELGHQILTKNSNIKVDVHNPQILLYVDLRKSSFFIYHQNYVGALGLPYGISGHGISLLSGGIDSPVATYMMAKRGMKISLCHFHSYPYTNERAKHKVIELAEILSQYTNKFELYIFNILKIQEAIRKSCDEEYMTILTRRAMMKLGAMLAFKLKADSLITGESLGQVASQTALSLSATNESVVNSDFLQFCSENYKYNTQLLNIHRPLVGFEKIEIMDYAKKINTFEKSIEPHIDCCSVFLPKHPKTKPILKNVLMEENKIDPLLLCDIFDNPEVKKIYPVN